MQRVIFLKFVHLINFLSQHYILMLFTHFCHSKSAYPWIKFRNFFLFYFLNKYLLLSFVFWDFNFWFVVILLHNKFSYALVAIHFFQTTSTIFNILICIHNVCSLKFDHVEVYVQSNLSLIWYSVTFQTYQIWYFLEWLITFLLKLPYIHPWNA
jgi:hypothetical protein